MNNKNARFTEKDDKVIMRLVSAYPQNLQYAFDMAAQSIGKGKTSKAVGGRYYRDLRSKSTALTIITKNGNAPSNVKVLSRTKVRGKSTALDVAEMALVKLTKEEKMILVSRILEE